MYDGRTSAPCICGEPLVRVENPFDNIWRWRHVQYGVIRDHVATPQPGDPSRARAKRLRPIGGE